MNTRIQYRQGDVLIQRIAQLPENLKPSSVENGKVILAHGEVTGHHHAFDAAVAEKMVDENGAEYFNIKGISINATLPILRRWKNQVMVNHPDHGIIEFAESDVTIVDEHVVLDGNYGLLRHQEHNTHGIPAGFYAGGGANNTVRQREYSPEAIRYAAD